MASTGGVPRGVWVTAGYFAAAGVFEVGLALWDLPRPWGFWPVWDALGRGLFHVLLALGLWRRIALCRSVAMVYCIAVLITYVVVLVMVFARAAVEVPPSLIVKSLYEVPSCTLLLVYLRSSDASLLFTRPLIG
jgi:hypothetical protein